MEENEAKLTAREKIALEYADRVMAYHGVTPEAMMDELKRHFSAAEIVALTYQIGLMNAANWFAIAMELER
jgi:alkylhydroperoxidase family enzyme